MEKDPACSQEQITTGDRWEDGLSDRVSWRSGVPLERSFFSDLPWMENNMSDSIYDCLEIRLKRPIVAFGSDPRAYKNV